MGVQLLSQLQQQLLHQLLRQEQCHRLNRIWKPRQHPSRCMPMSLHSPSHLQVPLGCPPTTPCAPPLWRRMRYTLCSWGPMTQTGNQSVALTPVSWCCVWPGLLLPTHGLLHVSLLLFLSQSQVQQASPLRVRCSALYCAAMRCPAAFRLVVAMFRGQISQACMLHGEVLLAGHGMRPHTDFPQGDSCPAYFHAFLKSCACGLRNEMLAVLCARRQACIGLIGHLAPSASCI